MFLFHVQALYIIYKITHANLSNMKQTGGIVFNFERNILILHIDFPITNSV